MHAVPLGIGDCSARTRQREREGGHGVGSFREQSITQGMRTPRRMCGCRCGWRIAVTFWVEGVKEEEHQLLGGQSEGKGFLLASVLKGFTL